MRGSRLKLVAILGVTLATVAQELGGQEARAAGPLQTALADPFSYYGRQTDLAFARTRATGATVVVLGIAWQAVAPKRPAVATNPADPAYEWAVFDRQVRAARAHGLEVVMGIAGAPGWAQGTPRGADRPDAVDPRFRGPFRPNAAEFGKFARAAARRYSGTFGGLPRVRYWLAWPEPNVSVNMTPQLIGKRAVSPGIYRNLLNHFASAVHGVRGDNVVVAGALSPFTVKNSSTVAVGPLRFMRELLCMSTGKRARPTCAARAHFDIGLMPLPDTPWTRGKCAYKALQYMAAGVPVVADDVGVTAEVVGQDDGGGLIARSASDWVEALLLLARDPDVRTAFGRRGRRRVEDGFSVAR